MMKGTDFMRGKKILAWVLVSAMVLSSGMGKLFSRKSMPQVVSGTRIVSDPPDSSVKVADITPVTMPEGEYEKIYSGMRVEKMTFAASDKTVDQRKIIESNIPVNGGETICFVQDCRSVDNPGKYANIRLRVYQYNSAGGIISQYNTSAASGSIRLNAAATTITLALNTVVSPHESRLNDRVVFNACIYREKEKPSDVSSDDTVSDVSSDDTVSDVSSDDTVSDVSSDDTVSDVSSDDTVSDVSSDDTVSDVSSDDTVSDVSSDDTVSDVSSDDTASDVSSDDTGSDNEAEMKKITGSDTRRKALDHGGFFTKSTYQDSPLSFLTAANEGIVFHNIDIVFSADNIPFVSHNDLVKDVNGSWFKMSQNTAESIKTRQLGDSDYSWTPQTLAETDAYIRSLGGSIEMVDVSAFPTIENAQALPAYYTANNLNPAFTNWDDETVRDAFIENGNQFGVYMVCNTADSITSSVEYIRNHPDTKFALNIMAVSKTVRAAAESQLDAFSQLNLTIYTYRYNNTQTNEMVSNVPDWTNGALSERVNVNYELWKKENS